MLAFAGIVAAAHLHQGPTYPPYGTLLGATCGATGPTGDGTHYYDQQGNEFVGLFGLFYIYADGYGGEYYGNQGDNLGNAQYGVYCYYPNGYCVQNNTGQPSLYWQGCGTDGNYIDSMGSYVSIYYADGNGGTYASGSNGVSWSGSVTGIYDNGCCYVYFDGNGGYYVSDTCGPSYPSQGTVLAAYCAGYAGPSGTTTYTDAQGGQWNNGSYTLYEDVADGNGGYTTIQVGDNTSANGTSCWYPMGYCTSYSSGETTVYWTGCGATGDFAYGSYSSGQAADGNGGSYSFGGSSDYGYGYGHQIYDAGNGCCYVNYDGNGGYYVSDNCSACPPFGQYVGSGCVPTSGYDASGQYFDGAWQYADVYSDGSCGTYNYVQATNGYGCYYPQGWKLDYTSYQDTFDWYVTDSQQNNVGSGNFAYHTWWYSEGVANGDGSTHGENGDWQAPYGLQIASNTYYDIGYDQTWWYAVYSDGSNGYYVSQNIW